MAQQAIDVGFGRIDHVVRAWSAEDGEYLTRRVWSYTVAFCTAHGEEWTLRHGFADSPSGAAQAARLASRVQAAIDAGGLDALDAGCWQQRVIYASQAYLDDEPAIVARERADSLIAGG